MSSVEIETVLVLFRCELVTTIEDPPHLWTGNQLPYLAK